jgi:hypothetical protein
VPAFWIFFWFVLAFGETQVQRELTPCLLCDPASIPVLASLHESFGELMPLTGAIADATLTLTQPVHLTLKVVTLSPEVVWCGDVRRG